MSLSKAAAREARLLVFNLGSTLLSLYLHAKLWEVGGSSDEKKSVNKKVQITTTKKSAKS